MTARTLRVIGPGRAGRSVATALEGTGRWEVRGVLGRGDHVSGAAAGVDVLLIAVPDAAVAGVAAAVEPDDVVVVAHLSGSLGLAPLAGHRRRAVLHPLVALPDAETGAARLRGAWFGLALTGDVAVEEIVGDLGGHPLHLAEGDWAAYHAAAAIASNHLVALLGQVDRVAATVGVPLAAYLDLVRGTVDNVAALGPAAALTGPVRRGDQATIDRHVAALPDDERAAYLALVEEAHKLCR